MALKDAKCFCENLNYKDAEFIFLESLTDGQATSVKLALDALLDKGTITKQEPFFISPSDSAMLYDSKKLESLLDDKSIDSIIFTFKNHPGANENPNAYGWVEVADKDSKIAAKVSVKVPISSSPKDDHAVVGAFYFRRVGDFLESYERLIKNDIRINNEFYVDSLMNEMINLGKKVAVFEVTRYICFGTPGDFESFKYFQSLFHKAAFHPYSLQKDLSVAEESISVLESEFYSFDSKHNLIQTKGEI